MTRRGWRKIESIAAMAFVIGTRSAGSSPKGRKPCRGGGGSVSEIRSANVLALSAGGMSGGIGLFSFICFVGLVELKELAERAPDGFKEIPAKRIGAEKFDRQQRGTDERAQIPRELAAEN